MKKIIIAVFILLLLGGAGAGYYFFFMQSDEPEATVAEPVPVTTENTETPKPIMDLEAKPKEITEYYVIERKISVYNEPSEDGLIVDSLYKGEKLSVLEKKRWLVQNFCLHCLS